MRALLLAAVVLMAVEPAGAREPGFDVQAFRPLAAPRELVGVGQSRPLSRRTVTAGAFLHFTLEPLTLAMRDSERKALSVVGPRLQLDVLAAVGLADVAEVGLAVPVVLAQASDNLEALGTEGHLRAQALGDVRLHGKVGVPGLRRRAEDAGLGAALTLGVGLPTGSPEAFTGEGALTWTPGAVVDYRFDSGALLALNAGVWLRPTREFLGVRRGNAATFGLGAEVPVVRRRGLTAVATFSGSAPLEGQGGQVPAEALVGLRWYSRGGFTFTVGGGGGMGCALTSPALRLFSSVAWVPRGSAEWEALERYKHPPDTEEAPWLPRTPVDEDGDSLIGEADRCPRVPGPVENGGCPDTDLDRDGVVDRLDRCPEHPAGPRGRDGCPWVRWGGRGLVTLEPVRFATGQEVLLPDSLPLLEEVAAFLLAHPEVQRMRVESSTDAAGDEALALSRRRAATVRQHLLESGIAEERLCAVGRHRSAEAGAAHSGPRVEFVLELPVPGPPPPCPEEPPPAPASGKVEEDAREVLGKAWEAARRLKRAGASLVLALRVEGRRVHLLGVREHEGEGREGLPVQAHDFRAPLEWRLSHSVRGHAGEVVLTLRRGDSLWMEDVEATGPVPSALEPLAPYHLFLRRQRERLRDDTLSEKARREGLSALQEMERWLVLQPEAVLEKGASPSVLYEAAREWARREEARWPEVQRKLAEYEAWGRGLMEKLVLPPHRLAPGYLLTESPLREQSLSALVSATLGWAYAHTEDPGFLRKSPSEVALYLLASRSSLATALHLGLMATAHLDYNEAFDPEVYTADELVLELLVGLTPFVGEVTDAQAAYTGYSLTGHRLSDTERLVHALGVLLPFVGGRALLEGGEATARHLALHTGRGLEEVRVLSRVASHLAPSEAREIERLLAAAARGHTFSAEEVQFLQRVARGLHTPLRESAEALRAGRNVPLLGARTLPDGQRLLPGSPAHKAQRWVDYQFRHPEKFPRFSFAVDPAWERMYHTILSNRPAGNAFESSILQLNRYERNAAMMMPPPGHGASGFVPDSVKGNPRELVWGEPYSFVEAKARQQLSLSGNLKAMIEYVEKYGGHLELWVRSAQHVDGATRLSKPLHQRLLILMNSGRAKIRHSP